MAAWLIALAIDSGRFAGISKVVEPSMYLASKS